jgi:hypothetical protein
MTNMANGVEHSTPNGTAKLHANDTENTDSFKLGNFSVDEARPIKVVAIGAGYSGKHYLG